MTAENENCLISIAVITYNQEDFIEECVRSVLDQDYRPIQIVVADDGSSDGTCAVIERLQAEHPGVIELVRGEFQGGITVNQNRALSRCRGDYVAWLGGDDVLLPGKLRRQVSFMRADPSCAISYHDMDVFDSRTGVTYHLFSQRNRPREGDVRTVARYGCFNCGSSTMVRRHPAPQIFDPRVLAASDWLFWMQTLALGGRIRYIDEVLGRYRRHGGSVTGNADRHRSLVMDHVISGMIAIVDHPTLTSDISFTLARHFVSLARRRDGRARIGLFGLTGTFLLAFLILRPLSWGAGIARPGDNTPKTSDRPQ